MTVTLNQSLSPEERGARHQRIRDVLAYLDQQTAGAEAHLARARTHLVTRRPFHLATARDVLEAVAATAPTQEDPRAQH